MKNTWHVESYYILQPPKYLIIIVNRFRYINNILPKTNVQFLWIWLVLGPHIFSLQATIDHHGPSMYSGHYTASINFCKRTLYCNDSKITGLEMVDTKKPLLRLLPWLWHILSIPLEAGRGISAGTCGLDDVFPPNDLGSGPCTPFIIYIPHIIAAFLLIKINSF